MNYKELKRANKLLEELSQIENLTGCVEYSSRDCELKCWKFKMAFNGEYKLKILALLKEIRNDMIEELKELGVTEEIEYD